jgi:cytochrome P450
LYSGGADTTVSAITFLFYNILAFPNYYKQLQSHIDELSGAHPSGVLTYEAVQRSSILDAYINEAMRLEPPIPYQNQRIVPSGGVTFSNIYLPQGTHVRTALYTIARLATNFSDPDAFRPERWLAKGRNPNEVFNAKASTPFIQGPYHCVGRNFAMAEMRWTVAILVARYNMRLVEGFNKVDFEAKIEDRSLLEIEGSLDVVVEKRNL